MEAKKQAMDRRNFLRTVGGASTAAAAAVVAPLAATTTAEAMDPGKEETKARYKETEHVKAFYRTNRY